MSVQISIAFGSTPAPVQQATHRVARDIELGVIRDVAPNPEVRFFGEYRTKITEQWQYYVRAVNYAMEVRHVSAIFLNDRMVTNGTAWGDTYSRANYFLREALDQELPEWGKQYTSGGAKVRMIGNVVQSFNGLLPPPLKPGRTYPVRVEDANIDDYLHTPYSTSWLFFDCHNVGEDGSYDPWPNAGVYPGDPIPRTWMPFVTNHTATQALIYPPAQWRDNSARLIAL
jgi:hypothetical protein